MIKLTDTKWRRLTEKLRDVRWNSDFTIDEIARRIGTHRNSLSGWELGTHSPQLKSFVAWADTMGYDVVLSPRRLKRRIGESYDNH